MSTRFMLLLAGIASLAACRAKDKTVQTESTTATPNVVSLSATEYSVQAPDTISAGWTNFRMSNHGNGVHYGHIVRLDEGKTVGDLVAAYAEAIRTSGPRPKWVTRVGGPGGTAPGDSSSVTQYIEPGSYVWICPVEDSTGTPDFAKGEVKPFVVVAAANAAVSDRGGTPKSDIVISLQDFSFAVDTPLTAGRHTIRVENSGVEPHDLNMMKLAPGVSAKEIAAWLNPESARRDDKPAGPPPTLESLGMPAGGVAAMAPKMKSFIEANLTPGEYAFFCMATAPDGRSHIEHGMIRQVSVR